MMNNSIYQDIAKRTGGDIYIGVVGPVRSGKSTFINKLLSVAMLDKIENEYDKKRTLDSMPQSASGKTVMTTEPKFIPDEAVKLSLADGISVNLRIADCVGYMVDGALGATEDGEARMVKTPWCEEGVDLPTAAEISMEDSHSPRPTWIHERRNEPDDNRQSDLAWRRRHHHRTRRVHSWIQAAGEERHSSRPELGAARLDASEKLAYHRSAQ